MAADKPGREPFRLLFVCTGNTCRSPLAAAIARRSVARLGWEHVQVDSAGTGAGPGEPASSGALRAAERHDLDLSPHRSTPLTRDGLAESDLVLVMSPTHLVRVSELGAGDRASLLTTFAAADDPEGIPASVHDPFGGSDEEYEDTYRLLELLVERTLHRLAPLLTP